MKVTQFEEGFQIDISDDEMAMLHKMMVAGAAALLDEGEDLAFLDWAPQEKAALNRRLMRTGSRDPGNILMVDEDRRAA